MKTDYFQSVFILIFFIFFAVPAVGQVVAPEGFMQSPPDDGNLNIIVFGAHPDDAQLDAGGVGALWSDQGHHVKFVSTTNGDIGHAVKSGGELAKIRIAEFHDADRVLGIDGSEVFDIHDGEIMPTLENRKKYVRAIREWKADIVIGHRPYDYHPDHRYTGILMQDAAYMVIVSNFLPSVPHLTQNPVFLFSSDNFQKPYPFEPDVVVAIDEVIDRKVEAVWQFESQIESWWAAGNFEDVIPVPDDPQARAERKQQVTERFKRRSVATADRYRDKLIELYGERRGKQIEYAEAFEVCEYGRQPTQEELLEMFPTFE
ncbi:MAG TPA: PIG-L family deacetylase [bacterium]|nr:PIG-L family deacetylase [bacterium]